MLSLKEELLIESQSLQDHIESLEYAINRENCDLIKMQLYEDRHYTKLQKEQIERDINKLNKLERG